MPPRKPHPRGKLRGFERPKDSPPPEPEPEPDPIPEPGPAPEPEPDPTPPPVGPVPDHAALHFPYLYVEGFDPTAEEAALRDFVDALRLWFWEKSGGLTWYHWQVYSVPLYPADANGGPLMPLGYSQDDIYAHAAQDFAGGIWRGYGDNIGGELGMVLFDTRPHEGGYAGARLGHAAHGFWAIDAIMGRPWPEKDTVWQTGLWPNISTGGYAHELCHAFGNIGHWPGLMQAHWDWPNTFLDPQTIDAMRQSPWLAQGPRPETGDWRRWA